MSPPASTASSPQLTAPGRPLRCVVSVSGIRGIIGQTLDLDQLFALAAAFGTAIARGQSVVLGRDSRPSGPMIAQVVAGVLRGLGCTVIDLGIVPTPTVPIVIAAERAAGRSVGGGIQISASHNDGAWNALKLFGPGGRNVDQADLDAVLAAYAAGRPSWCTSAAGGAYQGGDTTHAAALDLHLQRVLAAVDVERIRSARPKVLVDCVNGAGSELAPRLLHALGCEVATLHTRPELPFPRDPEPTTANLAGMAQTVAGVGAAVGFVQDPDADRLVLIDDRGRCIGEEYTLALCAAARFAAAPGTVAVTNLSTSRMIDDAAASFGGRVVRSKVGEAHVVDAMQAEGAGLGGEGNGGIIDPRVVWGRDSHIGMALILDLLARTGQSLSAAVAALPSYAMVKRKIALDRASVTAAIPALRSAAFARGAAIDERDGIRLTWPDRFVHLRASGTEPVSRIIAEAPSERDARALADATAALIGISPT